jgi:hypothetical protein
VAVGIISDKDKNRYSKSTITLRNDVGRDACILKELDVEECVRKWLEKRWKRKIDEHSPWGVDFLIHKTSVFERSCIMYEQIECKGTKSNVHRAIGQCLDYYRIHGCIRTYIAIPKDYKQTETLEKILGFFSLPIGILLINNEGTVSLKRKASGKIRYFKLLENKKGDLVVRSECYRLRAPSNSSKSMDTPSKTAN